ncbi:MAG: hypothetical protein VX399_03555 [SAR324 cluster bacterium]|nr:hypothetical protein [SAR324 cluster bacterium]
MNLNVILKDNQLEILNQAVKDFSISGKDQALLTLIQYVLKHNDPDSIFGEVRCLGDCYIPELVVTIDLEENIVEKLKLFFQDYDFEEYSSEEEELSKTIRSMINYIDQEVDLNEIF